LRAALAYQKHWNQIMFSFWERDLIAPLAALQIVARTLSARRAGDVFLTCLCIGGAQLRFQKFWATCFGGIG